MDLRERIVAACDGGEGTRLEVAQRKRTGNLRDGYRYCGRKARLMPEHGRALRDVVAKEPDLTLEEDQGAVGAWLHGDGGPLGFGEAGAGI